MSSLNEKGRSRYSKVLPDPPPGANVGIWQQQLHHKPLPIPASLSPGIPINSDKVNPLRSVTSVQSMNSLMSGISARSPPMIIFRRHKVSRPSPDSDEEPPALSHSWSDSSSNSNSNSNSSIIIEGKEPSSSSSSFDPEFESDIHSSPPPPPPPPANEKPKIYLSDHLLNSPHSFFCRAKKDKNNNNNNHNQKYNHSNHSNHHYDHQHRDDDIVAPLNIPPTSLASEFWRCRPARIDVHRSLIDLRSEHNHSSLRKRRGPAVDQPSSSSSPRGDEIKRVFSIQRRESPSSSSTPRDLMGNKLVRLKKSLGDLKSCPIYHEGDHPGLSAYRDRKKSPLPTSTSTTTNNVSSSFSSFRNEKSHDLLHQPASRDRSSKTAVSHSDSHHATSLAASSQSSASTTRAPTIPSSEALTLRSDSSMTALPQLQPHIQRHPPPPPSQHQQPSHPRSHSDLQSPTHPSPPQSHPQPTFIPEFPTTPSTGEIIFRAPPLNVVQLECYQKHRSMRSSRNKVYPVGCMICQKIDAEMRWRCTWCCLSACEDCNHKLSATTNKDLKSCLDQLGLQE